MVIRYHLKVTVIDTYCRRPYSRDTYKCTILNELLNITRQQRRNYHIDLRFCCFQPPVQFSSDIKFPWTRRLLDLMKREKNHYSFRALCH